jgi:class 3 adenylate cyclase
MTGTQLDVGTYDNTYFLFVDAAGHSTIFTNNPRDLASEGFDLLRERTAARLATVAASRRCAVARLWHWAGDGGLLVVQDERESVAVATALEVARCLVGMELSHLRDEFRQFGIQGELRLRVSVHKGPMRYRGPGHEGAMHSPAINLAAHLERATPPDTVAISADVHRVAGQEASRFEFVGRFEGVDVHVHAADGSSPARPWLASHGMAGGVPVLAHHERPSQHEKARLVDAAQTSIVEIGSALHTCANYLVTRERPARYQQAVLDFLERGGTYQCVLVDPSSPAVDLVGQRRGEDLAAKIRDSLAKFERFQQAYPVPAQGLTVWATPTYPPMAAFAVDLHDPRALLLYSPYLSATGPGAVSLERADMPHYLVNRSAGRLFAGVSDTVETAVAGAVQVL